MQQKSHQANTTDTNRLITVAQTASTAEEREQACHTLWSIYGDRFMGVVAKASYLINSDFNLQGCSPKGAPAEPDGQRLLCLRRGCPYVQYP